MTSAAVLQIVGLIIMMLEVYNSIRFVDDDNRSDPQIPQRGALLRQILQYWELLNINLKIIDDYEVVTDGNIAYMKTPNKV